nr:hypothetical protein [Escherichia coli]
MAESLAGMFVTLTALTHDPCALLTPEEYRQYRNRCFRGNGGTVYTRGSGGELPAGSLDVVMQSTLEQGLPQLYRTLSSLRYALTEQDDPQRLIGLTPPAQQNIRLLRAGDAECSRGVQAQTVGKLLDQVISLETARTK